MTPKLSAFLTLALLIGVAFTSCAPASSLLPTSTPLPTNTTPPTETAAPTTTPTFTSAPPMPTATPTSPITVSLRSIQMMDLTTGWAEGQVGADTDSRILHTTDGGTTWRDVSPWPQGSYEQQAFFLNAQLAWVESYDEVWRTEDSGQSWASLEQMNWGNFWFNDSQHGWKMEATTWGLSYVQFDIHSFSTTQDGGQTWEDKNLPPGWGSAFLAFPSAQMGWGVRAGFAKVIEGFPNLGVPFYLDTTFDGGQTWQSRAIPIPPGTHRVVSSDGGDYLGAGNCSFDSPVYSSTKIWKLALMCEGQGWTYTTINQGQTWIISPLPAGQAIEAQYINPTLGWLFQKAKYDLSPGQLYQTMDGGQNWTLLGDTQWVDARLDFLDAQTGWAVACIETYCGNPYYPTTLAKTTDGGQTWQTLEPHITP